MGLGGRILVCKPWRCVVVVLVLCAWSLTSLGQGAVRAARLEAPEISTAALTAPVGPSVSSSSEMPIASSSPISSFSVRFGPNAHTVTPVGSSAANSPSFQSSAFSEMTALAGQDSRMSAVAGASIFSNSNTMGNLVDMNELDAIDASLQSTLNSLRRVGLD